MRFIFYIFDLYITNLYNFSKMDAELFKKHAGEITELLPFNSTQKIAQKAGKKKQWVRKVLKAKGYSQEVANATINYLEEQKEKLEKLLAQFN